MRGNETYSLFFLQSFRVIHINLPVSEFKSFYLLGLSVLGVK